MLSLHNMFLLLHVGGAVLWVGGVFTTTAMVAWSRSKRAEVATAVAQASNAAGMALFGPGALLTLVGGFGLMATGPFEPSLWNVWGLVGLALSMALGGILIRPVAVAAGQGAPTQQRLLALQLANSALLASVILAMVFKPTF